MMRISETKLSSVIFLVVAIAVLTFCSLWVVILQHHGFKLNSNLKNQKTHFVVEFLLFNIVIASVFLSSLKPLSCNGKTEVEISLPCQVAEVDEGIHEGMNDDDVDEKKEEMVVFDHYVNGCYDDDECNCSDGCEDDDYDVCDDDIVPSDLEKRADEFIAKIRRGWMEEKLMRSH